MDVVSIPWPCAAPLVRPHQVLLLNRDTAMRTLRVVAWNLAEGTHDRTWDQLVCLNAISAAIANRNVDIVLLNEVCAYNAITYNGVDQVSWLAQRAGYPHVQRALTATLALRGEKQVAVLSRIPLLSVERIQHSAYWDGGGYATLHVTANIDGRRCHVFSTRFTAYSVAENLASHQALRDAIAAIPDNEAVIFGGDFNTRAGSDSNWPATQSRVVDFASFASTTRLRDVLNEGWGDGEGRVDHLLIRGPWAVAHAEFQDPVQPNPSDHPWVLADLVTAPDGGQARDPITTGTSSIFDGNGWLGLFHIGRVWRNKRAASLRFTGTVYGQAMEGSVDVSTGAVQFTRHLEAGYDQVYTGMPAGPGVLAGTFQEVRNGVTQPGQYLWRAAASLMVDGNGWPAELVISAWDATGAVAGRMYGDPVDGQWDRGTQQLTLTRRTGNPSYFQQWRGRRVTPFSPSPNPVPAFEFVGEFQENVDGAWRPATYPWILRERV